MGGTSKCKYFLSAMVSVDCTNKLSMLEDISVFGVEHV
jgi:hypothetical protein